MPLDSVDVLVVGGGLVGAAAALGAADLGLSVAVVERRRPERSKGRLGMDLRTVALAPASGTLLEELGVWQELGPTPYRSMRVWEERGAAEVRFAAEEVGRTELGWILEVSEVTTALWRRLEDSPGVTCLAGESLAGLSPRADRVEGSLGGATLSARLVIGADGARSAVRGQMGVGVEELETDQMAIATIAVTADPHDGVARQRFLLDGPLALLPGNEPRIVSVIWSQPAESARRRARLDDACFRAELERAAGFAAGDVVEVDERLVFPVSQTIADRVHPHPRVLLIGDAARVIHPLAGLGVNLGFEDVAGLLKILGRPGKEDPGADGLWRAFARRRKARSTAMMRFLAGLGAFYGMRQPLAHWIRNVGMRLVNRTGPVKRQLIREAMGLGPISEKMR